MDIGAFESSGFTIVVTSGSGQSTVVLTAFPAPLVATVIANNPIEPVAGGRVTFTAPGSGASATLTGSPATISDAGTVSVTAVANGITGTYIVSAGARGISNTANFTLTNGQVPTFSSVSSQTIVYGTSTTTLTGELGPGTDYPTGSTVSVTVDSVTQYATVDSNGDFSTTFDTASLGVADVPYTVTYAFAGNASFGACHPSDYVIDGQPSRADHHRRQHDQDLRADDRLRGQRVHRNRPDRMATRSPA